MGLPLARGFGFGPGFALAAVFLGSAAAEAADAADAAVAVVANGSLRLASSLSQNALGALRSRVLLPPLLPPIDAGVPAALADGVAAAGVVAVATAPETPPAPPVTLAMRCAAMRSCLASREPRLPPFEPAGFARPARTAAILFPSSSLSLSPMRCGRRAARAAADAGDLGDFPTPRGDAPARVAPLFSAALASFSSGDDAWRPPSPPGDT